jgi:hypothetical protein
MPNPNIAQGTLNRLVASVTWNDAPELNVIPSFLNRSGIALALDGEATRFFPTMTGVVTSNEPYQMITLRINLLKTQQLAASYDARRRINSLIGTGTVRPDVTPGLQPFDILNCAIESVGELSFAGEDPGYPVVVRGYVSINSSLWP